MAYTLPTAADLKTRYPAFAAVADATVNAYISDAPPDESWIESQYARAVMLWAAWAMTDAGLGTGGEVAGFAAAGLAKLKSGTLDVTLSETAISAKGYDTNVYGRQYADLLRSSKGGPRTVSAARIQPNETDTVWSWGC